MDNLFYWSLRAILLISCKQKENRLDLKQLNFQMNYYMLEGRLSLINQMDFMIILLLKLTSEGVRCHHMHNAPSHIVQYVRTLHLKLGIFLLDLLCLILRMLNYQILLNPSNFFDHPFMVLTLYPASLYHYQNLLCSP